MRIERQREKGKKSGKRRVVRGEGRGERKNIVTKS